MYHSLPLSLLTPLPPHLSPSLLTPSLPPHLSPSLLTPLPPSSPHYLPPHIPTHLASHLPPSPPYSSFPCRVLLPKLTECESNPANLGDVFISHKEQLLMYVTYCQNKASSDTLYHEFTTFFEEVKAQLKDRLELPDYLIMPVQRITKYTLLLHDFHKSRFV